MKNYILLLLALSTGLALSAQTEEQIDRRFTVPANSQLVVDVGIGSIDVTTHAGNEVVVSVFRKVTRQDKAAEEAFLRDHPVTFSQDGNTLSVRSPAAKSSGWSWTGTKRNEAKYTITVPASFNVRLQTSGGPISVSDLKGETKSDTSGGGLRFTRLQGTVNGHTSGGGIHVTDCEGTVKIDTSGGGIEVIGGGGTLNGDTSGGSVTVKNFNGPARVETSGGSITLENVIGRIEGSTSGGSISARFPGTLPDDVNLETSGGSVTVRLAENSAFTLDASTSAGSVSSDLPVTIVGKIERSRLSGAVNGGGKTLHLRSSGGGIHIRKL